jgi:hypothetical protein
MTHDLALLDGLSSFDTINFDGEVYRATRTSHDPLAPSTSGGRWALADKLPVLYTSLSFEGAMAELSFHWSQFSPLPTKPAILHRISVRARRTLRLLRSDLPSLGVDLDRFGETNYQRCQQIGAAIGFLECDGLIAPSARWPCENLVLFTDNHQTSDRLELIRSESIEWQSWARDHGILK